MKLTEEIKQELCEQVGAVIEWSQGIKPNVGPLIDQWFESKKAIIEKFTGANEELAFGCELDETVEMDISDTEKEYKFNNFMGAVGWRDEVIQLRDFLNANRDGFFDNKVIADYKVNDDVVITKGSKLLKAFKYFIKDEEERKWLQDKASVAIQECKITGKLCLSVHPLDFLSTSENTYNWRSCHALDGEYRAGNLNYMCDKSTIVCYLKGAEEAQLPNFPHSVKWNSKKWRCLLYLSDNWDAMFAGRQYPMSIDKMLDRVQQMAKICLGIGGNWSDWHNDQITQFDYKGNSNDRFTCNRPYIPMAGKIYPIGNLIKDGEYTHHYNDLLKSSCYIPYYCWSKGWNSSNIHFHIGEEVPCLRCGRGRITEHDMMFCEDCVDQNLPDVCNCDDCGNYVLDRDTVYIDTYDRTVCRHCFEHYYGRCEHCGNIYELGSMIERGGQYYCEYCYDNYINKENK